MNEKKFVTPSHKELSNPSSLQEQIIRLGRLANQLGNKQIPNPSKPQEYISIFKSNPNNLKDNYSIHANFLPKTIQTSFILAKKEYPKTTQIPFSIDISKKSPPETGSNKFTQTEFSVSLDPEGNINLFINRHYWYKLMPEINFPVGGLGLDNDLIYTDKCHLSNLDPTTHTFLQKAINNTQAAFEKQTKLLK